MNALRTLGPLAATVFAAPFGAPLAAQSAQVLWSNPWSNTATVDSRTWTQPPSDVEAADDFDVQGRITRVVVSGTGCFNCAPPVVAGATVRFYQWSQGAVGALQHEVFVPSSSPALGYVAANPETVDVTLPAPFVATGRHFLSVQLHFIGGGHWSIWVGNWGNPTLSSVKVRDRLGNNQWTTPTVYPWPSQQILGDLTFTLWGLPPGVTGQPAIDCATWSPLAIDPTPSATHELLTDVKVFATDEAWAVGRVTLPALGGYDEHTLVQRWNGERWTRVPSPSPGPALGLIGCYLAAVDGTGPNDVWAAGSYETRVNGGWVGPQVFAMHWDGSSWTVPQGLPLPNTSTGAGINGSRIADVKSLAANDVWFVGDWLDLQSPSNPITIRPGLLLHWDGSNLQQTILPIVTGVGHQYFNAVGASGPSDVWVVGGAGTTRLPGSTTPVVYHFDGSSWVHRPCPVPPGTIDLYDVEVTSPGDVLVFGTATVSGSGLPVVTTFMASWNGSGWTLLPGPPGGFACKAFGSWLAWAVGSQAWLWNGVSWIQQHDFTPSTDGSILAVDALSPCELFGVGGATRTGQITTFAARQDASGLWRTRTRLSLLPERAPASLEPRSSVRPGAQLRVAVDDPGSAISGAQATTFWLLGFSAAAPNTTLPFGGRNGGPGELLIDLATVGHTSGPVAWQRGAPAVHAVPIPNLPAFVGIDLASQAVMLAPGGAAAFTNALDLHVGW